MILKILGILLIVFGITDLVGSYTGFDLWGGFIGIQLPEVIWQYSSFIEMGLGYFVFNLGKNSDSSEEVRENNEEKETEAN